MHVDAALIREQGVEFAVVVVRRGLLSSTRQCEDAALAFGPHFDGLPIVLMAQDSKGDPTYWGRRDLVDFLSNVFLDQLPWKRYSIAA